jgi:hypothetical protein
MNSATVPPLDLTFWVPAMFVLGLVSMGLVYLFMKACEHI